MGVMGAFLCVLFVILLVASFIGAAILRAACAFYNKIVDPTSRVPEPGYGKAMAICVLTYISQGIAGAVLAAALGITDGVAPANQKASLMMNAIGLPVGLLVMAALLAGMLPTDFGKGILVSLFYVLVTLMVVVAIWAIIFVVVMAVALR